MASKSFFILKKLQDMIGDGKTFVFGIDPKCQVRIYIGELCSVEGDDISLLLGVIFEDFEDSRATFKVMYEDIDVNSGMILKYFSILTVFNSCKHFLSERKDKHLLSLSSKADYVGALDYKRPGVEETFPPEIGLVRRINAYNERISELKGKPFTHETLNDMRSRYGDRWSAMVLKEKEYDTFHLERSDAIYECQDVLQDQDGSGAP